MENSLLEFKNISKYFSTTQVLQNISFSIEQKKITALIGENGAGKSTLMNILCGVYSDYEGELILNDNQIKFRNPRDAEDLGIAMIHQELNLIPDLSIAENIFLGREIINSLHIIKTNSIINKAEEILEEFDFPYSPKIKIKNIPIGWQQMVEIAKALHKNAEIIVMDEPTSALSENEIEILFEKIDLLKKMGKTIIYISHRLKEVFTLADKVVVLRDGKFIAKNSINEVTHKKLIKLMIGKKIEDNPIRSSKISDKEILKIKNLNISNRNDIILSKINFSLKKGEVLGIAGLLGAGRTELLKFLFGKLEGRAIGGIRYINKKYVPQSPIDAINRGIIYLPEDRKREGNFNNLNLVFNYSISILEQLTKFCFIDTEKEKNEVIDIFDTLNVKRTSILQKINTLSGGNQQKVLLSRMLSIEPYLLMLDEPTRGIDVGAKQEIYDLIKDLSSKGLSIIMTSSEISELLKVCHKIAVLSHGKQTALLQAKGTDSKEILHYSIKQG